MHDKVDDSLYESQFAASAAERDAFADLWAVVRQLRRDCPWDREQTHASVRHLLIEEAYEVVEAIDEEDAKALREELGDVLLHVLFHSAIAEEGDRSRLEEAVAQETEKLVRRHPHVFGDTAAEDVDTVLANWEQIKQQEKEERTSALDGVPMQLPALLRAYRMQQKAAGVGFDFPGRAGAWAKVEEEIGEFHALEAEAPAEAKEAEFGDLLFALVNYARFAGINPENALRRTNATFTRRFQHVERRLAEAGGSLDEATLAEMDALWEEAKGAEQQDIH